MAPDPRAGPEHAAGAAAAPIPAVAPIPPGLVLGVGLLAVSTGALFVRLAGEAHPLVIALWRCALATAILAPVALPRARRELGRLGRGDLAVAVLSGVFLGLHFQTWIASLSRTSIASSSVLVGTTPIWVGLLTPWLSSDRLAPRMVLAIAICLAGSIVIGWGDLEVSGDAFEGDLLAVAGAVAAALYLLAGRRLRRQLSLPVYLLSTYGLASLWLAVCVAIGGHPLLGYAPRTVAALVALALVPQLIGHSSFNWSLRWVSAGLVAVVGLGEPILATLWGWLILDELPRGTTVLGGAILLAGIHTAVRSESRPS